MQERIQSLWNGLKDRWNSLEKRQKFSIIGIVASLILIIGIAVFLLARPTYRELAPNLDRAQMSNIMGALDEEGIRYRETSSGRGIEVLAKDINRARAVSIGADETVIPKLNFIDDYASSLGMSTSGRVIDQTLQNYKRDTVEATILAMDGVTRVWFEPETPEDTNFFLNPSREGTATVLIQTSTPSRKLGETIAGVVSSAYMDIAKENVYVADTESNVLYAGVDEVNALDEIAWQHENKVKEENLMKRNILEILSGLQYDAFVAPNLSFEYTNTVTESISYDHPQGDTESDRGFVLREETSNQSGSVGTQDAEPGLNANDLENPEYQMNAGESQQISSRASETDFIYDETRILHSEDNRFGRLIRERSSVAVSLYRNRPYYQSNMTEEELGGLTWEQFKDSNLYPIPMEVDQFLIDAVTTASGLENVTVMLYERPVFIDTEVSEIPYSTIIMLVILAIFMILLAYGIIKKTQPDEVTEIEPELSVEDLLVSTQLEEEKEAEIDEIQELQGIEIAEESEAMRQISKLIDEKPEAVAHLLRNWLNEDWD